MVDFEGKLVRVPREESVGGKDGCVERLTDAEGECDRDGLVVLEGGAEGTFV